MGSAPHAAMKIIAENATTGNQLNWLTLILVCMPIKTYAAKMAWHIAVPVNETTINNCTDREET